MTNTDLCSKPPIFDAELDSSGFAAYIDDGVEEVDHSPTTSTFHSIPSPTPTDLNTLFFGRKTKSHARRQKPGHVPRPRNAFILFRCDFVHQRVPNDIISDHRDLSRLAGCMWRKMSDEQKRPWFEKAEEEKLYHSRIFPSYRYAPAPGNRPKRVYKRKKPPVPDEILLKDPHDTLGEERDNSLPPSPPAMPSPSKVVHQSKFRLSSTSAHDNHTTYKESRYNFRDRYHSYDSSSNETEITHNSLIPDREHSSRSSTIGPFSDGFVQIPKQNDLLDWGFDQQGFWHLNSTSEVNLDP